MGATCLHAATRLDGGDKVGADAVIHAVAAAILVENFPSVWIAAGKVEEVYAGEDCEEAGEEGDGVDCIRSIEAAEEDERGRERGGRERDVVDWVDDGGWEPLEREVEVVHLCQDADGCYDHEDVGAGVAKLVVACEGELEGDAESLDAHDTDAADCGADGDEH